MKTIFAVTNIFLLAFAVDASSVRKDDLRKDLAELKDLLDDVKGRLESTNDGFEEEEVLSKGRSKLNCNVLAPSPNPGFAPGCEGAVWSNGVVSWRYCTGIDNSGLLAYPWHKKCCKYDSDANTCTPKTPPKPPTPPPVDPPTPPPVDPPTPPPVDPPTEPPVDPPTEPPVDPPSSPPVDPPSSPPVDPPTSPLVFQHCGFRGYAVEIPPGRYSVLRLSRMGIRIDDLSSISVPEGYEVKIYWYGNFAGPHLTLHYSVSCLTDVGLNDRIRGIIVQPLDT